MFHSLSFINGAENLGEKIGIRSQCTPAERDLRGSLSFLDFPLNPLRRAELLFPMAALASLTILLASCVVGSNRYSGTSRRCVERGFLLRTLSCFRRSVQTRVQHASQSTIFTCKAKYRLTKSDISK